MDKIKAIVFDWDGTIVDTMPIKIENAAHIFAECFGVDSKQIEKSYKKYSGVSRRELFDLIAKESIERGLSAQEFNRLSAEFTSRNLSGYKNNKVIFSGSEGILAWLDSVGFLLFISSSAVQEEIEKLAEILEIKKYFKEILGSSGDFKKGKAHINYLRNKYELKTSEIIFVGDDMADIRLSGSLGVVSVGIVRGKEKKVLDQEFADYVIENFSELKEIVSRV